MANINTGPLASIINNNNNTIAQMGQNFVSNQRSEALRQQILQDMEMKQYRFQEEMQNRPARDAEAAAKMNSAQISIDYDRPLAELTVQKAKAQAEKAGVEAKYADQFARTRLRLVETQIKRANAAAAASGRANHPQPYSAKSTLGKLLQDAQNAPSKEAANFLVKAAELSQEENSTKLGKKKLEEALKKDETIDSTIEKVFNINITTSDPTEWPEGMDELRSKILEESMKRPDEDLGKLTRAVSDWFVVDDGEVRPKNRDELIESLGKELEKRNKGK